MSLGLGRLSHIVTSSSHVSICALTHGLILGLRKRLSRSTDQVQFQAIQVHFQRGGDRLEPLTDSPVFLINMDAAMQADPARLARREETVIRGLNMDLEAVRKTALQRAEEALSSSASISSISIPPRVHPSDPGTKYDIERCLETLRKPVIVNRLCAEDLEKAFHLFCTAVKAGMDPADGTAWGFAGDLSFQDHMHVLMMLLKHNASAHEFYTIMVQSGLAGLTLDDWLAKNLIPQDVALKYLTIANDLATGGSTDSNLEVRILIPAFSVFLWLHKAHDYKETSGDCM